MGTDFALCGSLYGLILLQSRASMLVPGVHLLVNLVGGGVIQKAEAIRAFFDACGPARGQFARAATAEMRRLSRSERAGDSAKITIFQELICDHRVI